MLIDDPRFPGFPLETPAPAPSDDLDRQLARLSAAEEFFDFFGVPFEQPVLNVNRLHILKRFSQYLRRSGSGEGLDVQGRRRHCRGLLVRAYEDFVHSTAAQEKVFKVFESAAARTVSLETMKASLDERRPVPARPAS